MTDLPKAIRDELVAGLLPPLLTPVRTPARPTTGATIKSLWRLYDGALVESVLMRYPDRVTMCVSSQAGCGMNCPFCATGQAGPDPQHVDRRDRRAGRARAARSLRRGELAGGHEDAPLRVSNVVFMGMGEALANYKAAIGAIRRLVDPAPDGPGHVAPAASRCRRSGWCRRSTSSPTRASR